MLSDSFQAQAALLLRILPYVAEETCFALKGGTAINFFIRDLPRLSVDIDLVYLPIADRDQSLAAIRAALGRIADRIRQSLRGSLVNDNASKDGTRIITHQGATQTKIEVTPVLRGTVYPVGVRSVSPAVQEKFGFAETQIVSFADLYAGKLVAALDRQHPRDLFDVRDLLANEGIDAALFRAFLVYIISHNRPAHEVIAPRLKDIGQIFEQEFVGMTVDPIALELLLESRRTVIAEIHARIDDTTRHFLRSFHQLQPDWNALGLTGIAELPAVRWKLLNLTRLRDEQPAKYRQTLAQLDQFLDSLPS
jgi:predicted nucleotidyltransferase component of viral defense system